MKMIMLVIAVIMMASVCYAEVGDLQRAPDGTYVSVPEGGQVVRAPDGTYQGTGPSGWTERAPDGSWHGNSD